MSESVTSLYASEHPEIKSPDDAVKCLFKKPNHFQRHKIKENLFDQEITQEDLEIAAKYGRFSQRPSDLFLKLFYSAICTLELNPLAGCISPQLIGTSGVIPLTIISTIPDIMHYYYHIIVHAQKEILFATCWWEKGDTASIICNALRDLSKRAAQEKRHVIVKLLIDRFTKDNLVHTHAILPSDHWEHCNIPKVDELPFVLLEVNTSHRLIVGASHAKFLVADRKIALLNSNNIYDRPNLEMMVHYEGDIVNSFYDIFLISWQIPFNPRLVCLQEESLASRDFHFFPKNASVLNNDNNIQSTAVLAQTTTELVSNLTGLQATPHLQNPLTTRLNQFARLDSTDDCNLNFQQLQNLSADFSPFIFHTAHQPFPIALVNRTAHGTPGHTDKNNPQNAAWLAAFRYARKSIFIQTPNFNASLAIDGVLAACRRGIKVTLWLDLGYNDRKEGHGTFQGGTNEHVVNKLCKELKDNDDDAVQKNLEIFWYTAKDQTHPRHFSEHKRNCHVKFMAIDDQVAIMGSANMDTQSWFHSEEINTMIDSALIVKELVDALYKNQSTDEYGRLDYDDERFLKECQE